jgi:hypothetical protein
MDELIQPLLWKWGGRKSSALYSIRFQNTWVCSNDEPFPLSNDVVHAVIVVKLYGGRYAAYANGEIGLLAFFGHTDWSQ